MNLYHLRYFVTLAHLEHYTKAAELLSITQPKPKPCHLFSGKGTGGPSL